MDCIINKEKCEGCHKNILIQHRVVVCNYCDKIVHGKCSKAFTYNHLKDIWVCEECSSTIPDRYNPFDFISDKHCPDIEDNVEDVRIISSILECCTRTDMSNIKKSINNTSILFNNIDGNASNFDNFATELASSDARFSIFALAETNIDASHKDLYNITGIKCFGVL